MLKSIKFFYSNLSLTQTSILLVALYIHVTSHISHMEADKLLAKNISKILSKPNDNDFSKELFGHLYQNLYYLIIYAITMLIIESIGKLAVKYAITKQTNALLKADLSKISKQEYEQKITAVVHHSENVTSAIRNLFIEFPRKIVACHHFLIALTELSWEVMLYCTMANLLFVLATIGISYVRKNLVANITDANTQFSIICSDLSNSIQAYKVDNRITEYQAKIKKITTSIHYNSTMDSLMVASTDAITSFSSQFMVGLISYTCRPMLMARTINISDLMYGVRSSSKFVEKMMGILEYFGDVVRQYKSFSYFDTGDMIVVENPAKTNSTISKIVINDTTYQILPPPNKPNGQYIRIAGPNGVGKTTLMYKLLGVDYLGATTTGRSCVYDNLNNIILPYDYRDEISFVQQQIPLTYDTVAEYLSATSGMANFSTKIITAYFESFEKKIRYINNFLTPIYHKSMRELSGGQAKMVQIIAAFAKLCYQAGCTLILDEPTNNLDIEKIDYLKKIIKQCLKGGITVFIVTHDKRILTDDCTTIELK